MNAKIAPMGWNSWDCFGASVNEETVRLNADFMAKHLKKYGYEYIVVDIQWSNPNAASHEYDPFAELCMDGFGRLLPAVKRFPSSAGGKGFKPLSDYIHSLGLKFGIHIMRGIPRQAVHNNTPVKGTNVTARQIALTNSICSWNTDMYGVDVEKAGGAEYYASLSELYSSWGVDFIKVDDICRELPHCEKELIAISQALKGHDELSDRHSDRKIVLSLSPGPALIEKAELYKQYADMWRITDDFWDKWELLYDMFSRAEKWSIHTGAGHWPDADMLPVGPILQDYDTANRTKFTADEQITMMTLWCIFRSPLMIGGDMTGFDSFTVGLLTNPAILKMHRNARHAHQVWRRIIDGKEHVLWVAVSAEGGCYAAVFNLSQSRSEIEVELSDMELYGQYSCTELWSGRVSTKTGVLTVCLPPHGAKAFYIAN